MVTDRELLVMVAFLPPDLHLCHVVRHLGVTVLAVDPFADRCELVGYLRRNLTDVELDWLVRAFGWPPGMVPMEWLEEVGPMLFRSPSGTPPTTPPPETARQRPAPGVLRPRAGRARESTTE